MLASVMVVVWCAVTVTGTGVDHSGRLVPLGWMPQLCTGSRLNSFLAHR
jgi:hypothetical protein